MQDDIRYEDFDEKYPHFAEHFKPYLKKLANRYSYNRTIPYWEFVFPRNQKLFERKEPRIFIPCKERTQIKDISGFVMPLWNFTLRRMLRLFLRSSK